MNRLLILLSLTLCLLFVAAPARAEVKGSISFAEKVHDFGNIKEADGKVSCEFDFTNMGGANLVILDAKAECGCTKPSYPEKPIGPGKSGKIKVSFNPAGRAGAFSKNITVRTNGKPGKVVLRIKGTIIPNK